MYSTPWSRIILMIVMGGLLLTVGTSLLTNPEAFLGADLAPSEGQLLNSISLLGGATLGLIGLILLIMAAMRSVQKIMSGNTYVVNARDHDRELERQATREAEIEATRNKERRQRMIVEERERKEKLRTIQIAALPKNVRALLTQISTLDALLQKLELDPRSAMDYRNYIDRELPEALDAYLSLPSKLQSRRDPVLGTPLAVLTDHLTITVAALEAIHDNSYQAAQRTLTSGRDYLADKTGVAARLEAPAPEAVPVRLTRPTL